jgi:ubiquinone/menaquinone biosynthesis C-methylase UbiE
MAEIDLLDTLPKIVRKGQREAVTSKDREIASRFGREYFDGPRTQGYGGYVYDGRWKPVARRLKEYYRLNPTSSVADIGCAKGFLLNDLKDLLPGLKFTGLDISEYAYRNSLDSVRPMLCIGNARDLPWRDRSFDLVLAINTLHNLELSECRHALEEIQRVSRGSAFVVIDAYRDEGERERLLDWILTAKTFLHVKDWKKLFREAGYTGDYYWFILDS